MSLQWALLKLPEHASGSIVGTGYEPNPKQSAVHFCQSLANPKVANPNASFRVLNWPVVNCRGGRSLVLAAYGSRSAAVLPFDADPATTATPAAERVRQRHQAEEPCVPDQAAEPPVSGLQPAPPAALLRRAAGHVRPPAGPAAVFRLPELRRAGHERLSRQRKRFNALSLGQLRSRGSGPIGVDSQRRPGWEAHSHRGAAHGDQRIRRRRPGSAGELNSIDRYPSPSPSSVPVARHPRPISQHSSHDH